MTSPAKDISDLLHAAGIGIDAVNLWTSILPEDIPSGVSTTISVKDTGGFDSNPAYLRDEPTVQITVRSEPFDYETGYAKAEEIKNFLLGKSVTVVNGKTYTYFWLMGDITPIGLDELKRHLIVTNWHFVLELPSGGNRISL